MMAKQRRPYRAWLLRLWPERSGGQLVWRASLEEVPSGVRQGFGNLAQLFAFLETQAKASDGSAANDASPSEPE
jgi:hypothetical protein